MDRLRVPRPLWGALFAAGFVLFLGWSLGLHPSLARAISKNGSITAYVAAACSLGLYLSILVSLVVRGIVVFARRLRARS